MDKVTQHNAANSEESSSAAEELSSQSQELAAMVGSFVLDRSGRPQQASGHAPGEGADGAGWRASAPGAHGRPALA
jgi:hypothetical protein